MLLLTAPSAWAHATVVSTSPDNGAVLGTTPARVSVSFDEAVTVAPDSLRVFDPAGVRVDVGGAAGTGGGTVAVRLRPGLVTGTYVAAWHVVSADSHPVEGAFTFSIGAPSASAVNPSSVNPPASRVVCVLYTVARFLAFAGFAVLVGAVLFLAVCWPSGADRYEALAVVERGWALLVLGSLGGFLLQGVYGSDTPLTHATHPQLVESTFKSTLGIALTVRLGVLICLVPLRNRLDRLATAGPRTRARFAAAWGVLGAGLGATWAFADHASVGIQVPAALVSDSAHLLAIACWLGGLVMLALVTLRASQEAEVAGKAGDAESTAVSVAVDRFSRVAAWSVGFIALTGVYQAWRGVGSWGALTGTAYGRLVLVKLLAFGGLLGLGHLSRRVVARVRTGSEPGRADLRRLRRTVATEAGVAAGILAVSALLVATRTGREDTPAPPPAASAAAFDTGGPGGRGTLEAEPAPAPAGRGGLRLLLLDPAGRPYTPAEVTATVSLAARGIGPVAVRVVPAGPGAYTAALDGVSVPGSWTLAVTIRSDDLDETTVRVPVPVR